MKEITVLSFAKINLSIDVGAPDDRGYHAVDMIMQQVDFSDYVKLRFVPAAGMPRARTKPGAPRSRNSGPAAPIPRGNIEISLRTNRYYLPTDERNLAYKAAQIMIGRYGADKESGRLEINIKKRIPVAAGMAGGSGNGAAVVHGLNILWNLQLPLSEILDICSELGSDVPFSAVGQARANRNFPAYLRKDAMATSCVRATGRGTEMVPVRPLEAQIVVAKPRLSVSTAEVYKGIDSCEITERPDNDRLERRLNSGAGSGAARASHTSCAGGGDPADCEPAAIYDDFINVLEQYTLQAYPQVKELKELMESLGPQKVLMSGSGPTVFAVCENRKEARRLCARLRAEGYEAYWMRTTR